MYKRQFAFLFCVLVLVGLVGKVEAASPDEWRKTEEKADTDVRKLELRQNYTGVTPGKGNNLPRVEELKGRSEAWVTWPGFMLMEDGGSRIFVQATESLKYIIKDKGTVIILSLRNAKVHLTNNRNPLVTTHFNTPLKRAYIKKRKKEIQLVMELKVSINPQISRMTDNDGYHYMFIDFPPGEYPIADSGSQRPTFSDGSSTDETPPANF